MTSPVVADYLTADEVTEPGWQITAHHRHMARLDAWRKAHRVAQEDVPIVLPRLVAL